MNTRILEIEFGRVQSHQHANFVARVVLVLVNLVVEDEFLGKMFRGGEGPVVDENRRIKRVPGVLVEIAANHLAVIRPFVVAVAGGVHTDEAFSVVMDEAQQVCFLRIVQIQLARREECNSVEVAEVLRISFELLLGYQLAIGAEVGVVDARLSSICSTTDAPCVIESCV